MDETSDNPGKALSSALLRTLRPVMPAVIGAAALTFLFAAVMPFSWVAGIAWNLYLDRLSNYFVPPVGNAARLILALTMAAIASLIAGLVAVLIAKPEAAGLSSLRRRFRRSSDDDEQDEGDVILTRRRRADLHPDDPPRAPIRAGRDLPAGGLGPLTAAGVTEAAEPGQWLGVPGEGDIDELVLADLAPADSLEASGEPWLQPAEMTAPVVTAPVMRAQAMPVMAMPDPSDNSIGAMVARFEAGLARRRQDPGAAAATTAIPRFDDGRDTFAPEPEPEVDFALEAALSTLQRMTRQSVG